MNIPLGPKFFKKLELYETLGFENKRAAAQPGGSKVWKTEKRILEWTRSDSYRPGMMVNRRFARETILKIKEETLANIPLGDDSAAAPSIYDAELKETFSGLVGRGYAREIRGYGEDDSLVFTNEGLLMGEVISDIESDGAWVYRFLIAIVWIALIAVVVLFVGDAFRLFF